MDKEYINMPPTPPKYSHFAKSTIYYNALLVSTGVRSAWLDYKWKRFDDIVRMVEAYDMNVHVQKVTYSEPNDKHVTRGILVTRDPLKNSHLTHLEMGKLLDIPCSSNRPWARRSDTDTFFELEIVKRGSCYTFGNLSTVKITTFFCKSRTDAEAWFATFKKKSAGFVRKNLAPADLSICFRMHTFLA